MIGDQALGREASSLATRMIAFTLVETFLLYTVSNSGMNKSVAVTGIIGAFAIALTARTRSRGSVLAVSVLVSLAVLVVPLFIAFMRLAANPG